MTLGCGGFGGNITSDNISPRHLLNIKRLAYELRPLSPEAPGTPAQPRAVATTPDAPPLPASPGKPAADPIPAEALARRIDTFLASRGIGDTRTPVATTAPAVTPRSSPVVAMAASTAPVPFVCEDDVRQAVKNGQTIVVGERTIITPAARDAGEAAKVFVWHAGRPH
jgi:hypothetical protein